MCRNMKKKQIKLDSKKANVKVTQEQVNKSQNQQRKSVKPEANSSKDQ